MASKHYIAMEKPRNPDGSFRKTEYGELPMGPLARPERKTLLDGIKTYRLTSFQVMAILVFAAWVVMIVDIASK